MTLKTRKLVGTVALLLLVIVYAFLAMVAAIVLQVNATKTVEVLYYLVAGLLWVPPAAWIISWMHRAPG